MRSMKARAAACAALLFAAPAFGFDLSGRKTLTAITGDGREITIGAVTFAETSGAVRASVEMDRSKFEDFFLSMREFKCLNGGGEIVCHVPYPYANPGLVSRTDFAWLEHALLFLTKSPTEVGANLWNGLYFHLTLTDDGLIGEPRGVDLNQIASPPDDPARPPFAPADQGEPPSGAHFLAKLRIR